VEAWVATVPTEVADRSHVVVVGAGFGGLTLTRRLAATARHRLRITLVDRHNYHTFQPLLYQVATAGLDPQSIGHSVRGILHRTQVAFRMGTVTAVDWDARQVQLEDGDAVGFDTLVLAAGASTADYGIEGVAEHAFPLKSLPEATRLRNHILRQFERMESDPRAVDDGALTFVIAGGGPTGVELSGATAELIGQVIRDDHPHVDLARARIILVEMQDALLSPYSEANQRYTRQALEERGVEVRLGVAIEAVHPDRVVLSDGDDLPTRTVVWTAGVRANPVAGVLGVEQTAGGRVVVGRDLRIPGHPEAFVIGDLAGSRDARGELYPQLAPVAIQQGRHVADQIVALRRGGTTAAFDYVDKGTMATIGRNDAVAELPFGIRLRGALAWVAWLGLHIVYLIGFRNRATVLLNWTYNYLTHDRAARLILEQAERDEGAELEEGRAQRRSA
jgi:NADH dehydrogenase